MNIVLDPQVLNGSIPFCETTQHQSAQRCCHSALTQYCFAALTLKHNLLGIHDLILCSQLLQECKQSCKEVAKVAKTSTKTISFSKGKGH